MDPTVVDPPFVAVPVAVEVEVEPSDEVPGASCVTVSFVADDAVPSPQPITASAMTTEHWTRPTV